MQFKAYNPTQSEIDTFIEKVSAKAKAATNEIELYTKIFSFIDLTTLEATDNPKRIQLFCEQALAYTTALNGTHVAAVCVYMPFVAQCREQLKGSGIEVATVACSFPSGQIPLQLKLEEVKWAVAQGAQEIDMVISRGDMLAGAYDLILEEVKQVKEACGEAHLKVILETGELREVGIIRKASELALLGGADFLKTSTGKVQPAATPEAAVVMLDTIKEYYEATGKKIGFKPAGGIAEPENAMLYYKLVETILGEDWLNPRLFRIGASRLATKIADAIANK